MAIFPDDYPQKVTSDPDDKILIADSANSDAISYVKKSGLVDESQYMQTSIYDPAGGTQQVAFANEVPQLADNNTLTGDNTFSGTTTVNDLTATGTVDLSGASVMLPVVAFFANSSTAQSLSNGSNLVTNLVEQYDYGNCFASNAFTAPVKGIYHFSMNFESNNAPEVWTVGLTNPNQGTNSIYAFGGYKDWNGIIAGQDGGVASASCSADMLLNTGDVVRAVHYVDDATTRTTNSYKNYWMGHLVARLP